MLISTILEMVGLGFIFSIVGVLNPTTLENNIFVNKFSDVSSYSSIFII